MRTMGIALVVPAVLALACGGTVSPVGEERKPGPPLVLKLVDGTGSLSLVEQKGKVVLVDLWATWCAPCISELPHLQRISESYDPEDFTLVGIVLESGDREEILEFIRERNITYPNLLGEEGAKDSFGPFLGYPTKYLIDKEGYIVKKYFGAAGDEVARDVEKLVRTGSLKPVD